MQISCSKLDVIILAAGKSKRMRSAVSKVLHRICAISLLERGLQAVSVLKPRRIIVVVGFGKEAVCEELSELSKKQYLANIEISHVVQQEQKGTGHAVKVAMSEIRSDAEAILIMPGDIALIDKDVLLDFVDKSISSNIQASVLSCELENPFGFGRIVRDENGGLGGIVEELDCTDEQKQIKEINSSVYWLKKEFLEESIKSIQSDNAQGEYYLTDIIRYGVEQGFRLLALKSENYLSLMGANTREELGILEAKRREQINAKLMNEGVTLQDAKSTYIEEGVVIEADVYIGAGCQIKGTTVIKSNTMVENNVVIENSHIGASSKIKAFCVIEDSEVAENCIIGPFAHLRAGSKLHDNVHVGNFVETKKTEIFQGAKANHLSYLGDSHVGAGSNIGAGTITCNYDSIYKHKTFIGEKCFIGSNTALVAPVRVESGAFVAAGSTITKDVPKHALGIARGSQRNIDKWVERKYPSKSKEK